MLHRFICRSLLALACSAASLAGENPAPVAPIPASPPAVPQPPKFETPADIKDLNNLLYLMDLARVQLRYQDIERCEETLRKALTLAREPNEKQQALTMLGQLLQRKQDLKGASAAFEEALAQATDIAARAQLIFPLCDILSQQNESAKAEKLLTDLRDAVSKDSKLENGWVKNTCLQRLMAIWRKEEGKIDKVIAALEAEAAKDPANVAVTEQLAELYTSGKRDSTKAARMLEKLIERSPKDVNLQMRLAMFYAETREYDKALGIHKKIVEGDPKFNTSSSHYQIASLLLQSGKKEDAVAWARKNLNTDAGDPGNGALLGMFFEQAALNEDAMGVYEAVAAKASSPQMKADYLLRSADLARRTKSYEKAEKTVRAVLKDNAADKNIQARAKQALIRIYEDQGKIGELKFDN